MKTTSKTPLNRQPLALFLVALFALGVVTVSGQAPEKPRKGFLSVLNVGQPVNLKDTAGRFEISTIDDGQAILGHKVIEVGPDYVTVIDIAGVAETRITVLSIKCIITFKVPK